MATGITIFGTLNGTLGETVYYREGGLQRQRIRNRRPKNPQTNKQLFQRARFSAAGMFYAHGRQSFFPYAFEDKRNNESNFNAFMRNNTAIAYPVSKSVVNNVAYPILHNWVVTKGSLPTLNAYRYSPDEGNTQGLAFDVPLYSSVSSVNTMADLSKLLIATGDYENGDIITFLTILTEIRIDTPAYGLYPEIVPSRSESAHWFIRQFNLNTADTTPLSTYQIGANILEGNVLRIYVWGHNTSWWPNQLAAGTIVHSRVKGSRTQVSTQALVLSDTADAQINTYLADNYATYVDEVIANWRSGDQTIILQPTETLQGANSVNFNFQPEPTPTPVITEITTNPLAINQPNATFVTSSPLPHGALLVNADLYISDAQEIYGDTLPSGSSLRLEWNEQQNAWISYEEGQEFYTLREVATNTYQWGINPNNLYLLPWKIEYNGTDIWINPNDVTRYVASKVSQANFEIDYDLISIAPSTIIANGLHIKLKIANGAIPKMTPTLTVTGNTTGFSASVIANESEGCFDISFLHNNGVEGNILIKQGDKTVLTIACIQP